MITIDFEKFVQKKCDELKIDRSVIKYKFECGTKINWNEILETVYDIALIELERKIEHLIELRK
jgi:hypothetical protein